MKYEITAMKDKDSQWVELYLEGPSGWVTVEMSSDITRQLAEELDVARTRLANRPQKEVVYSKSREWGI